MPETIRTSGAAVTLVLTVEELRTLLADNTDLVSGLFATLAERSDDPDNPVHPTKAASELQQLADRRAHGHRPRLRVAVRAAFPACLRRGDAACGDGRGADQDGQRIGALPRSRAAGGLAAPDGGGRARGLAGHPAVTARGGDIIGIGQHDGGQRAWAVPRRSSTTGSPSKSTGRISSTSSPSGRTCFVRCSPACSDANGR